MFAVRSVKSFMIGKSLSWRNNVCAIHASTSLPHNRLRLKASWSRIKKDKTWMSQSAIHAWGGLSSASSVMQVLSRHETEFGEAIQLAFLSSTAHAFASFTTCGICLTFPCSWKRALVRIPWRYWLLTSGDGRIIELVASLIVHSSLLNQKHWVCVPLQETTNLWKSPSR